MNESLYRDANAVLKILEGLPYNEAKIVLLTALAAIEKHCYLDLTYFDLAKEVQTDGK